MSGWQPEPLDPLHRINPTASVAAVKPGAMPTYYECGICSCLHDARWDGDCRQDNARFNLEDLDALHGDNGWNEIAMEEVDDWRESFGE